MGSLGKCMRIRHIVRLRQIVKKWRKFASARKTMGLKLKGSCCIFGTQSQVPEDVPYGHLAVYVGQQCSSRFVIRVSYLNHPIFRALLEQAEQEFGFSKPGGLAIPCDESLFEHILRLFGSHDPMSIRHLDLDDIRSNFSEWNCSSSRVSSVPLVHAFAEKSMG